VPPRRRTKRKFTLRRFWASLRLPFFEVGGEWERKPTNRRRDPSRKVVEARIKAEIEVEQRATDTPTEQMLREIEEASAKKFRRALKDGELAEIGAHGVVRKVSGDELRRRKGLLPSEEQRYW